MAISEPIYHTILHRSRPPERRDAFHARGIFAANGDLLVFLATGQWHYGQRSYTHDTQPPHTEVVMYRSTDKGRTWSEPQIIARAPFGSHGAAPFRPIHGPGSPNRLYIFATEPTLDPAELDSESNTLGIRYSDDHGHTWSDVSLVYPTNAPDFLGIAAMKPVETPEGTWLWGAHTEAHHRRVPGELGELVTLQFVLRSDDFGASWTIHPCPAPAGGLPPPLFWKEPRCEEANLVVLPSGRAAAALRTIEGHVWWSESADDGRNWHPGRSTGLRHPCAPAPVYRLADGRLLILTHNTSKDSRTSWFQGRHRLWISLSEDEGATWGEPHYLATTTTPDRPNGTSYPDMVEDAEAGELHFWIDHHFQHTGYVRLKTADLETLETGENARPAVVLSVT
jgi:hypothetical protein